MQINRRLRKYLHQSRTVVNERDVSTLRFYCFYYNLTNLFFPGVEDNGREIGFQQEATIRHAGSNSMPQSSPNVFEPIGQQNVSQARQHISADATSNNLQHTGSGEEESAQNLSNTVVQGEINKPR